MNLLNSLLGISTIILGFMAPFFAIVWLHSIINSINRKNINKTEKEIAIYRRNNKKIRIVLSFIVWLLTSAFFLTLIAYLHISAPPPG